MAEDPVVGQPDEQPEEEEGGPVKSFLEHLEDLRWVLIKSAAAAGVAMLACLLGGNYVISVLEWPLTKAPSPHKAKTQQVRGFFGTNLLSTREVATNDTLASLVGTNQYVRLDLVPLLQGTNQVLGWQTAVDPDPPAKRGLPIQIINLSPAGSF